MKLKWNCKHPDDDVGQGEVRDVHVGHGLESPEDDDVHDQAVASYSNDGGRHVQNDEEYSQAWGNCVKSFKIIILNSVYVSVQFISFW